MLDCFSLMRRVAAPQAAGCQRLSPHKSRINSGPSYVHLRPHQHYTFDFVYVHIFLVFTRVCRHLRSDTIRVLCLRRHGVKSGRKDPLQHVSLFKTDAEADKVGFNTKAGGPFQLVVVGQQGERRAAKVK